MIYVMKFDCLTFYYSAEKSDTPRHLAEFWMIEPEVAFANLEQTLDLAESFVRYCVNDIVKKCEKDIHFFQQWVNSENAAVVSSILKEGKFARIEYTDAVTLLQKNKKVILQYF